MNIPKLHKIGEYGHGDTVLVISTASQFHDGMQADFLYQLNKTPKVFLYSLDLINPEGKENPVKVMSESLANTLNKFYFAKILILDFVAFITLYPHLHKIDLFKSGIKRIMLFNPYNFCENRGNFITLLKDQIRFSPSLKDNFEQFIKFPKEIESQMMEVISIQDSKTSLRIATFYKNTRLNVFKNYSDALNFITNALQTV